METTLQSCDINYLTDYHSQLRRRVLKEWVKETQDKKMTFCLYECLKSVGLQRHYSRFTSAGVCRAAHLSSLTIEDYPHLGICTMEDKYRLFDLVQLVKSLDLDHLEYDDGDGNNWDQDVNDGDEDYAGVNGSFNHHSCGNSVEDKSYEEEETETYVRTSCVRRQLDFSDENTDPHQKLASRSVSSGHVNANYNANTKQVRGKESAVSLNLRHGNSVVCGCKENNKHKPDVYTYLSNHHLSESINLGIAGGKSMSNSDSRLPSRCASFHQPIPNSKTFSSVTSNNKSFGYKNRRGSSRKQSIHTDIDKKGSIGRMAEPTAVYEAKRTTDYNYGLPLTSPPAPNKKQAKEQHISVCVRKRPLTRAEKRRREADVVTTTDRECVIVHEGKEAVDLTQYILQHRFYFDYVFGEESSNEEVYRKTAYPLVQHMLSGGKSTCFAYGQTGAGKTHTMLGSSPGRPGLYALAVQDIFTHLSTSHTHLSLQVYVSFFEIYCGQLYDLLDHKKRLFAREDGHKVVHISGLRDVRVDSINSLLEVISHGTEERTQGMSGVNPVSSRSHALLQIQLRDPNQQIAGRMWFVDLAGSERASDTKEPDKHSRMEGAEINQSLLALKECIRSLDQEQSHTPFRQSKLTQVLKDSFVGNSMTCMIANISPGHTATEHTLNTLRYADRVKELKGQGGLRGRRGSKTMPFSKHNPPNSNSSGGSGGTTRGKSPPKKPKLGKLKGDFCPITPATSGLPGRNIFCSTPKQSRCGDEANATCRDKREIGLEHVTPVRGWLVKEDMQQGAGERKSRKIETKRYGTTSSHYVGEPNVQAGPIHKPIDSRLLLKERGPHGGNLSFNKTESGLDHREKGTRKSTTKENNGEDRKWKELRKQVKSSRDTASSTERRGARDFQNTDEGNNEREIHLRRYHEHLQTLIPSSTLCFDLFSSTQSSISTSEATSSVPDSSCLSVNAHDMNGLEEVLARYAASVLTKVDGDRGQLPSSGSEVHLQTETLTVNEKNSGNDSEDCMVPLEVTGAISGQDRVKGETRRLQQATGEARVRRGDRRPAGVEIQEMRLAWGTIAETKPANMMTGAILTHVGAQASNNCDSGDRREVGVDRPDASHGPADGVWSTEGAADSYSLKSAQSSSLSKQPHFGSTHQQAPAERPLSPAREYSDTFRPLASDQPQNLSLDFKHTDRNANIMQLAQQNDIETVPSNRHREGDLWFSANVRSGSFSHATTLPLSTSTLQSGCTLSTLSMNKLFEHPAQHEETKASVLTKVEAHEESSRSIMDPLSISQLQTDQQAATVSFLQGEISDAPHCLFESESGEDNSRKGEKVCLSCADLIRNVTEDENEEFNLSLLRLPHITPRHQRMSDSLTSTDHTEKLEICRKERNKPNEVWQELHQNQEYYQKPQMTSSLDNKDPASPLQHTTHSPIKTTANNTSRVNGQDRGSNQQMKPIIHLFTPDDLDQAKWGIIEAHWEQLTEMEALSREEGMLLCQQPDMAFGEYVHKLEKLMERKAWCVHSMRAQLRPYLTSSDSQLSYQQ